MKEPALRGVVPAPATATALAIGLLLCAPPAAAGSLQRGTSGPPAASATEVCSTLKDSGRCPDLVELEVRDVIPLKEASTNAVVLVSKDQQVVLPIFVDEGSALAIAFRLAHRTPPQPLCQDLLDTVLSKLGGQVTGVRIDDVHEHMLITHIFIQAGSKHMGLAARPSDAVAMALSGGARIFATKRVMSQAGITKKEIEELRKGGAGQEPGVGGSGPGSAEEPPALPPDAEKGKKEINL